MTKETDNHFFAYDQDKKISMILKYNALALLIDSKNSFSFGSAFTTYVDTWWKKNTTIKI